MPNHERVFSKPPSEADVQQVSARDCQGLAAKPTAVLLPPFGAGKTSSQRPTPVLQSRSWRQSEASLGRLPTGPLMSLRHGWPHGPTLPLGGKPTPLCPVIPPLGRIFFKEPLNCCYSEVRGPSLLQQFTVVAPYQLIRSCCCAASMSLYYFRP